MTASNRISGKRLKCDCGKDIELDAPRSFTSAKEVTACKACQETRHEAWKQERAESKRTEMIRHSRKSKAAKWHNALSGNIPPLFAKARLADLSQPLREKLLALPVEKGLYLWGPVGCGKSHTLCALARHFVVKGFSVKRVKWDRLCLDIRDTYNREASEVSLLDRFLKCHKLILEDLGTSVSSGKAESDFAVQKLLLLLDERVEHCLPTFISSNKPLEEIHKSFDQRSASRIAGNCEVIKLAGKDKRLFK